MKDIPRPAGDTPAESHHQAESGSGMVNAALSQRKPALIALSIIGLLCLLLIAFIGDEFLFEPNDFEVSNQAKLQTPEGTQRVREAYSQWALNETRRTFRWQARSTKIIFWTSVLITVTGISFSFWQFIEASRSETEATKADEIQVKTQLLSLAFKSRSVATLMMFISLAYLLAYLLLVYPITPVQLAPASSDNSAGAVALPSPTNEKLTD